MSVVLPLNILRRIKHSHTRHLVPSDFVTETATQISMSNFDSLSRNQICLHHFNLRSLYFNFYNLCQITGSNYMSRKPHQCALHFSQQITKTHFLPLQPSIRPVPAQAILLWKGPSKLCIECHLVSMSVFPPKSPGNLVQKKSRANRSIISWKY